FYNGSYESAAAHALALTTANPNDLAAYELRTSALLFQLKRALGEPTDQAKAFKECVPCQDLMTAFLAGTKQGQEVAREMLKTNATDEYALFFLGKLDLNYVWLQLGTVGKRTGWNEYWEARKSLDTVLKANPKHTRARVARAWIDYIVDTKMTRGFRWILGGGNKKKALAVVADAAATETDFFARTEAGFAIWDLHMRERHLPEAVKEARLLARDFPENRELVKFLAANDSASRP
ncbi:MAG: hypothetical protein ABI652_07815, partial [Acidobacteriota bacterium]